VKYNFSLRRPEQGLSWSGGRKEKASFFILHANRLPLARLGFERGEVPKEIAGVRFHEPSLSDILLFVKQGSMPAVWNVFGLVGHIGMSSRHILYFVIPSRARNLVFVTYYITKKRAHCRVCNALCYKGNSALGSGISLSVIDGP
jgi:hypothetical protein